MATTFLGSVGLSEAFPGFVAVLTPLRGALASLRAQAQVALAAVAQVRAELQATGKLAASIDAQLEAALGVHLEALLGFKLSIRLLALADLEVQLQAALSLEASIGVSLSDPTAYISGLISAVGSVQVNLLALVPAVALDAQLSAALSMRFSAEAKIAAFDLALDAIVQIGASLKLALSAVLSVTAQVSAALSVAVQAMAALTVDLQAALALVVSPLNAAVALEASLNLNAVELYRFDGPLSALAPPGSELGDSIAGHSLLPLATPVRTWVLAAPAASTVLVDKLTQLLKSAV